MKFTIRELDNDFNATDVVIVANVDGNNVTYEGNQGASGLVTRNSTYGSAKPFTSMSPEQVQLWFKGLMNANYGSNLVQLTDDASINTKLTDEEKNQLEELVVPVGSGNSGPVTKRVGRGYLPSRLTRK